MFANRVSCNGLPRWLNGKEYACQCRRRRRRGLDSWVGKMPWRRKWHPTPVFLPGESHGQRSLVGYSPWGCKELDRTKNSHTQNLCKQLKNTRTTQAFTEKGCGDTTGKTLRFPKVQFNESFSTVSPK